MFSLKTNLGISLYTSEKRTLASLEQLQTSVFEDENRHYLPPDTALTFSLAFDDRIHQGKSGSSSRGLLKPRSERQKAKFFAYI